MSNVGLEGLKEAIAMGLAEVVGALREEPGEEAAAAPSMDEYVTAVRLDMMREMVLSLVRYPHYRDNPAALVKRAKEITDAYIAEVFAER